MNIFFTWITLHSTQIQWWRQCEIQHIHIIMRGCINEGRRQVGSFLTILQPFHTFSNKMPYTFAIIANFLFCTNYPNDQIPYMNNIAKYSNLVVEALPKVLSLMTEQMWLCDLQGQLEISTALLVVIHGDNNLDNEANVLAILEVPWFYYGSFLELFTESDSHNVISWVNLLHWAHRNLNSSIRSSCYLLLSGGVLSFELDC